MLEFENESRRATDFAALRPASAITGANPVALIATADGASYLGALAGTRSVVLLDGQARELARADAPFRPSALAIAGDSRALVVGRRGTIATYRVAAKALERGDDLGVDGAVALVDIEVGPKGATYVADEFTGALSVLPATGRRARWREFGRCHGPRDLIRTPGFLLVNCLLDHQLRAWSVDEAGVPRGDARILAEHDGPLWSVAAIEVDGGLRIAATGVENRPLDRSDGGFAFIDSFLYLYEARQGSEPARQVAAINASEHGVVVPKSVAFVAEPMPKGAQASNGLGVLAYAYASDRGLRVDDWSNPKPAVLESMPGVAAIAGSSERGAVLAANELLDGWVRLDTAAPELVAVAGPDPRSVESRVGEALFFTTLMAPWSPAEGRRSRFTCETCHFRGYGDGRVHYTGRGKVHASTKALLGLFNNRPHFSRALDKTMAQMVHAEFRVANKHNGRSPWFELERADFSWLRHLGDVPETLSPEFLRRSFMSWLMDFTYSPNPAVADRKGFSEVERAGAAAFRGNCAMCHSPRLVADRPDSTVAFDRWEELIFSDSGPILWARSDYRLVGVEPPVHEKGTRVPSLRRLYTKYPYFTNGTAASVDDVLEQIRFGDDRKVWHAGGDADARALDPEQRAALRAFLRLL